MHPDSTNISTIAGKKSCILNRNTAFINKNITDNKLNLTGEVTLFSGYKLIRH